MPEQKVAAWQLDLVCHCEGIIRRNDIQCEGRERLYVADLTDHLIQPSCFIYFFFERVMIEVIS